MAKAAVIPAQSTSASSSGPTSSAGAPPAKPAASKAQKAVRAAPSTSGGTGKNFTPAQLEELNRVFVAGQSVWALSRGTYHRAQVKEIDTDKHPEDATLTVPIAKVHYPGWGLKWDEWLMGDSMLEDTPENEVYVFKDNAARVAQSKADKSGKDGKKVGKAVVKKEAPAKPAAKKEGTLPIARKKASAASVSPLIPKKPVAEATKKILPPKAAFVKPRVQSVTRTAKAPSAESAAVGAKRPARGCNSVWASNAEDTVAAQKTNGNTTNGQNGRGERKPPTGLIEPDVISKPASLGMKLDSLRTKRPLEDSEGPSSSTSTNGKLPDAADNSPTRLATQFDAVLVGSVHAMAIICSRYITTKFTSDDIATLLDLSDDLANSAALLKQSALNFLRANTETIVPSPQWQEYAKAKPALAKEHLTGSSSSHPSQPAMKKTRTK